MLPRHYFSFGSKLNSMKKLLIAVPAFLLSFFVSAQQNQGTVTYQRTIKMEARFVMNGQENVLPQSRQDKFQLSFANNQSLWKQAEQDNTDDNMDMGGGGGMRVNIMVAGSDDVLYCNFDQDKSVALRMIFDKKFIVEDSIRSLGWKLSDETKTILNHTCRKAVAIKYGTRMTMNMENGKMERKEVNDTSTIVAWFTTDIPVSAGPAEYQGQLPGLILALDVNNGRQTFEAVDISDKADISSIKEPPGKKHITPDEFNKERDKMMQEMQKNNPPGGNRQFRFGN